MARIPVIAVLDAGKTNKKLILFDESYTIRFEKSTDIQEITDEDGFPCEDISGITRWVNTSIGEAVSHSEFSLKAVNFSAHGAGFVHLDGNASVAAPLYNYLKPYPEDLKKAFYDTYGSELGFSKRTASPVLGSLNSGMQLYRLAHERPNLFNRIRTSLHLPQYLSFLLTHKISSDITSIGCHTGLWDFVNNSYHRWVHDEGIFEKLAPILPFNFLTNVDFKGQSIAVGIGLHDSSAALIPYLKQFEEDFALLSTGTWNITLNPFNAEPLTEDELSQDCLCYLNYHGKSVKASRLFAGHAHQLEVDRMAEHFHQKAGYHQSIIYDKGVAGKIKASSDDWHPARLISGDFFENDLSSFESFDEAYYQLIIDLVAFQKASTALVLGTGTRNLFVDGGFSKNRVFMSCLADAFPELNVFGATVSQASSLGAALAIHDAWNTVPVRCDIIELNTEL